MFILVEKVNVKFLITFLVDRSICSVHVNIYCTC